MQTCLCLVAGTFLSFFVTKPLTPTLEQAVAKDVPSEELERAKNAAISAILINLESRAVMNEDIGRQILTYGHRCLLLVPAHLPARTTSWAMPILPQDISAPQLSPHGLCCLTEPCSHACTYCLLARVCLQLVMI